MKTRRLFHLVMALNLLLAALPLQAAQAALVPSAAPESLLAFTSGGHALGFAADGMYAATGTHALHVEFLGANAVRPKSDSPAGPSALLGTGADGKTAALSRVEYADLWDGIDLTYTSEAGSIYTTTYTVEPGADPAAIRLRYNAPLTINEDGTLGIAFETGTLTETAPLAWQDIDGQRVAVDAAFQVSAQEVGFVLGSYDPSYELTIDPSLAWNTFLGGDGNDFSGDIAVTLSGDVYVVGSSSASWGSPLRAHGGGSSDVFVAKLTASGGLTWNTFLGGSGGDNGMGIAVDGSGNVYVAGNSSATWGSPVGAYTGGMDAFAAKLDSSGGLTWNTFLGGSAYEYGYGIAVDGSGNVYVAGFSTGTWGSPVRAYAGGYDAFAAKLNSAGSLTWNTFLGGSGTDSGYDLAVDGTGNVYVAGGSDDSWGSPVAAYTGLSDAFAAKLDSAGALTWNTFLGGSGEDIGTGIAVDIVGNVCVAGYSDDTWGSPGRAYTAGNDTFAAKLNPAGSLTWNTFLGGSGDDISFGITVDGSGNVHVSGRSNGTWGSPVRAFTDGYDAFAAKLTSPGGLTWNTFLGGSGYDQGYGSAVDGTGNIYVSGSSLATWGSPVRAYASDYDTLAAKLNSAGSLTWNTFLGGSGGDDGIGIAVDGSGNVYVSGNSNGSWGSPLRAHDGDTDAFVAKLNTSGALIWNTFLGGSGGDYGYGIAVDGSGNIYMTGYSNATWGSPVRVFSGSQDAFAAKLNTSGALTWNTFLGGSGGDDGIGIAVDGSGNVYVAGDSSSTWGSPVRAFTGTYDDFVAKLTSSGGLTWNTFLGGSGFEETNGLAVDGFGNVYVAGYSSNTWGSPVRAFSGGADAFVAKLTSSGGLTWNTFLGGSVNDVIYDIAVDVSGNVYVAGRSSSTWGSPLRAYAGGTDGFAAKLDSSGGLTWNTFLGGSWDDVGNGIAVDGSGNIYVTGYSSSTWGSPVWAYSGLDDAFITKLSSSGALTWNTFLGGSGTDHGNDIAVYGFGNVYLAGYSTSTWGSPLRAYAGGTDGFVAMIVPTPPGAFSKTSPADTAYASTSPTLTWGASVDADDYEYCYDTNNNNACDSSWISAGTSTSASLSGLVNNDTYYWQVRATNGIGTTEADGGTWWSFTTPTFADVPITYWAWSYIERLFAAGITGGCASSPLRYCPSQTVTRAQMAIFLERGINGSSYTPPPATGTVFGDVPISHWAAAWIEKLYADGITGGCGGGNYCPEQAVTRAEMAIFLLRAEHGSAYIPPGATGTVFGDVPISHWAGAWIEQLYAEGITGGCGGGNYCPNQAVTRAEMAIFLVRTFSLP